jgi:hypothetical protein
LSTKICLLLLITLRKAETQRALFVLDAAVLRKKKGSPFFFSILTFRDVDRFSFPCQSSACVNRRRDDCSASEPLAQSCSTSPSLRASRKDNPLLILKDVEYLSISIVIRNK